MGAEVKKSNKKLPKITFSSGTLSTQSPIKNDETENDFVDPFFMVLIFLLCNTHTERRKNIINLYINVWLELWQEFRNRFFFSRLRIMTGIKKYFYFDISEFVYFWDVKSDWIFLLRTCMFYWRGFFSIWGQIYWKLVSLRGS